MLYALLCQIKWENRFTDDDKGDVCLVGIDGVDFKIQQLFSFTRKQCKKWFSHKLNKVLIIKLLTVLRSLLLKIFGCKFI